MVFARTGRFGALTMVVCAAAVTIAGCGSSGSGGTSSSSGSSAGQTTGGATTQASGSTQLTAAERAWAVTFSHGTSGAADSSKPPFVIGWANQQGSTPSYPAATAGAEGAVRFINAHLGGIDGRPVKLDECFIQAEEDGQRCGAQFLADKQVQAVVLGLAAVGNASLYKTVLSRLPVLVATSAAQADQTTPGVYTLNGGSLSPIAADALLAARVPGAKRSAVMYSSNPIGTFVAQRILKPVLQQQGLGVSLVPISDTATAPEVVSAIQASGAASAQVFQMTTLPEQCSSAYDALRQQNLTPRVITTYQCSKPSMAAHLDGKYPAGWVFTGYGDAPQVPNLKNGRDTYVAAMDEAGTNDTYTLDGDASISFSTIMALARISNDLGAKAAPETIRSGIVNYHGPLMMTPGTPECGRVSRQFPGICTTMSTVSQADANGKLEALPPVDVKAIIR